MKRSIIIFSVFVVGFVLTRVAMAGDLEDIKKATLEHFATLNNGDAAAHIKHHLKGHTTFGGDGSLLQVDNSLEKEKNLLQAQYDAGLKINFQLRHLDVQLYGNTAVVTGYVFGTVTTPDGTIQQSMDRRTAVVVKQGNDWKEVHIHTSPVISAQSQ